MTKNIIIILMTWEKRREKKKKERKKLKRAKIKVLLKEGKQYKICTARISDKRQNTQIRLLWGTPCLKGHIEYMFVSVPSTTCNYLKE